MTNFRLQNWLKAFRVPFFTATIVPVLLGSVTAWHDKYLFSWPNFWLTLIGALLMHAGTNMANDYFDHISGCDEANTNPTPFSGGSRVIQEGLLTPRHILYGFISCFILAGIIGLYLNYICGGITIIILASIGLFLAIFYSAKPFKIGYRTLGELAVGTGFGPLVVMGSYYVQAHKLPFKVFLISIPVGILIALVLYINEFPDYVCDKQSGKRTLVVALGKRKAMMVYHFLLALTYLSIIFLVASGNIPWPGLLTLLTIPLAFKAFSVCKNNFDKVYELLPANAATIGLHSLIGILLVLSFLLDSHPKF